MHVAEEHVSNAKDSHGHGIRVRLLSEAQQALSDLSPTEWLELLAFSAGAAAVGTVHSKFRGITRLARRLQGLGMYARTSISAVGVRRVATSIPNAVREASSTGIRRAFDRFVLLGKLDRDMRIEVTRDIVVAGVTAYLAAGKWDLEGGIPDLDLCFGPGLHRNPFSHSVVLALTVEAGMRFTAAALARLHSHLPAEHEQVWDWALDAFNKTYESAIVGVWLGLALHLLKDVGLPGVRTKPYVMLPMSLTNAGHQALFAGNAALSACLGYLTAVGTRRYTLCAEPEDHPSNS